jgi:hypothetical protein
MKKCFFFISLFAVSPNLYATELVANHLKPFTTDYCTMFVDGTISRPTLWRHCCVEHDINYWYGGSNDNKDTADNNLKSCVKEVAGSTWANLIYIGVRAGHLSPIKGPYRWSWGWESKHENSERSTAEKLYIIEKLQRLPLDSSMIEMYIKNHFPNT